MDDVFQPDKFCNILRFSWRVSKTEYSYKLSGHYLQTVSSHKYLGVTPFGGIKWNTHINKIVSKANGMLGFVRRNLSNAPCQVKIQAYKSLVRPHVEYCSLVWDPHTSCYIKKAEAVQRQAAHFIMNDYGNPASIAPG